MSEVVTRKNKSFLCSVITDKDYYRLCCALILATGLSHEIHPFQQVEPMDDDVRSQMNIRTFQ